MVSKGHRCMTSSEWESLHDMIWVAGQTITYDSRIEKDLPHLDLERVIRIFEDKTLGLDDEDINNSLWAEIEAEYCQGRVMPVIYQQNT